MTIDAAWLQQQIRRFPPASALYVGFSGGLDSHVLLHLLASIRADIPTLQAIHVHHGLQRQADDWTCHAQSVCDELGIPLTIIPVVIDTNAGKGIEAAAREARYQAFASAMKDGAGLLTAHHRDDQAETLLLQLFRGAGPAGLASMPRWAPFAQGWHGRPLLPISREGLEHYASRHQLEWVDDPSNEDIRLRRNFIRHKLMPLLKEEWPEVTECLANVASLQAEALNMMRTLGRLDLEEVDGQEPGTLSIQALLRMQEQRRKNLIRYWLWEKGLAMPGRRHMSEIDKLLEAGPDSEAEVCFSDAVMRHYKDDLYAYTSLPDFDSEASYAWSREEDIVNPANGELLRWQHLIDMGLNLDSSGQDLTLRFRQGGERIKLPGHEHHKKIKHLMQEAGIPPWERDRIPFIYEGDRLLAVYGYWVNDE